MSQIAILNRDDPVVSAMRAINEAQVRCFSKTAPKLAGDMGLLEDGITWLACAQEDTFGNLIEKPKPKKNNPKLSETTHPKTRSNATLKRLMPAEALSMQGAHNVQNALAALLLAHTAGQSLSLSWAQLLPGLRSFVMAPHRCEFVRQINGVDYIDDSKGTNVGATVAALNGFDKPIVLIAGGLGKGQDFSPLIEPVQRNVKAVFLIGADGAQIAHTLQPTDVPCVLCSTLEEAVQKSAQAATAGDLVLLSPACASMDMFKSYSHRGQVFVQAVHDLAMENGEIL